MAVGHLILLATANNIIKSQSCIIAIRKEKIKMLALQPHHVPFKKFLIEKIEDSI
jgi:hypothetical protein